MKWKKCYKKLLGFNKGVYCLFIVFEYFYVVMNLNFISKN